MARRLAALLASRSSWFDLGVFAGRCWSWSSGPTFSVVAGRHPRCPAWQLLSDPADRGDREVPDGPRQRRGRHRGRLRLQHPDVPAVHRSTPYEALVIWSLGVLVTQITSDKRPMVKLFNIGVGIIGGGVAAAWSSQRPRRRRGHVPARAGRRGARGRGYFATDFVLSAVSVAIETDTPVARAPGAARHPAGGRLLRALRLAGLPRRGRGPRAARGGP